MPVPPPQVWGAVLQRDVAGLPTGRGRGRRDSGDQRRVLTVDEPEVHTKSRQSDQGTFVRHGLYRHVNGGL